MRIFIDKVRVKFQQVLDGWLGFYFAESERLRYRKEKEMRKAIKNQC